MALEAVWSFRLLRLSILCPCLEFLYYLWQWVPLWAVSKRQGSVRVALRSSNSRRTMERRDERTCRLRTQGTCQEAVLAVPVKDSRTVRRGSV